MNEWTIRDPEGTEYEHADYDDPESFSLTVRRKPEQAGWICRKCKNAACLRIAGKSTLTRNPGLTYKCHWPVLYTPEWEPFYEGDKLVEQ